MIAIGLAHVALILPHFNWNSFDYIQCKRFIVTTYFKILSVKTAGEVLYCSFTVLDLLLLTRFHATGLVFLWKCLNFLNKNWQ